VESNLPRFLLTRVLYNAMFFLPIWVVFVQDKHGLDLVQVTLLDSAFWLTMALTEIPTGAVADTLGRKWSYAIGIGLSIVGNLSFGLAGTYPMLLVANSLWAAAVTFISGADMAFLYDTLRELGREGEYPRFRGIVIGVDVVSIGLSGLVGGFLYARLPEAPFLLYSTLLFIALLVILTFREPARETDPETGLSLGYRQVLGTALRTIRARSQLRFLLIYSNFLPVAVSVIEVTLIQPHAVGIGLPVISLGVILLGFRSAHVLGSVGSVRLADRLGDQRLFRWAPLVMAAGVIGLGLVPTFGGLAVFGLACFSVSAMRPVVEARMLAETPGSVRATILSFDSLIFRLLLAAMSPFSGLVADAYSLPVAFVALGTLTAGVLISVVLVRERTMEGKTAIR
jgi:MFS family permease